MGQKSNPIGLRLQINRTWDSRWFAEGADYGRLLLEDLKAVPAGDASASSPGVHCLRSVGLDRSTPCRLVQVAPDAPASLPHRPEVAVYRPVSARLAGKPA